MSHIAYIISAYKDAKHLARLINALDDRADFYVHIDRRTDSRPFRELLDGKVTFVPSHWISWGGWEQVEYQRELLGAVLQSGKEYTRVVCLSGQDYPLWSNERIHDYFDKHSATEFIKGVNLPYCYNSRQVARVRCYHFFRDLKWKNLWWKNKVIVLSRYLMKIMPIHKAPYTWIDGKKADVYAGSDYWAITLPCARYVYKKLCSEKRMRRYFKTSFVPSELCVQTIVFNSPFAKYALLYRDSYPGLPELTPLHYIEYGKSIKTMTLADFLMLKCSERMFCRKVVSNESDELVKYIDAMRTGRPVDKQPEELPSDDELKKRRILTIVVSYNFEPWIDRCLGSLRQSEQPTDVVVIDNASQDNTVQIIRDRYPEVRLITNKDNLGFGQANNIGMRIALDEGYDSVFLLNQDAWIQTNTIKELSRFSKRYTEFGVISPVHLNSIGEGLEKGFYKYTDESSSLEGFVPVVPCPFINAALWFIPIRTLQLVGGFNPLFFHYGEDVDFVNRLHYFGSKLGYIVEAYGCHARDNRREDTPERKLRLEEVYLLTEYANLNYSFPMAFCYSVLAAIKKAYKAAVAGKWPDVTIYLGMSLRLLKRSGKVYICRRRNITGKGKGTYLQS